MIIWILIVTYYTADIPTQIQQYEVSSKTSCDKLKDIIQMGPRSKDIRSIVCKKYTKLNL
jgi:hypothetical protein